MNILKQLNVNVDNAPLIKDEINKKWMKEQMMKYEHKFGYKVNITSDDDWLPTPHGLTLAEALMYSNELKSVCKNKSVLELGSGVGNHTMILYKQEPKLLCVTEVYESRLECTKNTFKLNNINNPKNVEYIVGDWLNIDSNKRFDILITNPPFAASGKRNRRYFIDELILNSNKLLNDNGYLIFIQSSAALIEQTILRLKQNGYYNIKIPYIKRYYWRDYYFDDITYIKEADYYLKNGFTSFDIDNSNGERIETLFVVMAQIKPWKGTSIQHSKSKL